MGQVLKIRSRWTEIAGEVLSAHTEPVVVKAKVLHVLCDSPAWAQQVGILSTTLLEQIRKITGVTLTRVEGRFGMVRRPPDRKPARPALTRPDIDPADIDRIRDSDLAAAVRAWAGRGGKDDG
jgi:predicted nucleic acid-binding Zn ribbon protein